MNLRLIAGVALAGALAAGCSATSEPAPPASVPAASQAGPAVPSIAASPPPEWTAAACGELNRLTREEMDRLATDSASDWEQFAFAIQSIANGAGASELGGALTTLATGALTASERLADGDRLLAATSDFYDAVLEVDGFCKRAGAPLS